MSERKQRLTVTVDPEVVAAGNSAVAEGRAASLSGWVNDALGARARNDQLLRSLADVLAGYEAQFGEITAVELAAQERADRAAAVVVRGRPTRQRPRTKRPGVA